jgi:hypothetical protein
VPLQIIYHIPAKKAIQKNKKSFGAAPNDFFADTPATLPKPPKPPGRRMKGGD